MLHYVNQAPVEVLGRVVVLEGDWSYYCANCKFWEQEVSCQALVVIGGLSGLWPLLIFLLLLDCYSSSS